MLFVIQEPLYIEWVKIHVTRNLTHRQMVFFRLAFFLLKLMVNENTSKNWDNIS